MIMDPIAVYLREDAGIIRRDEPAIVGIPLEQGGLHPGQIPQLRLVNPATGQAIPCQFTPLAHWHDGSVRWLSVRFLACLPASDSAELRVEAAPASSPVPDSSPEVHQQPGDTLTVSTDTLSLQFTPDRIEWTRTDRQDDGTMDNTAVVRHQLRYKDAQDQPCTLTMDKPWQVVSRGNVSVILECHGHWLTPDQAPLGKLRCRLEVYRGSGQVKVDVCLHNPNRARHSGGLWDLGDPGSLHFRSLELVVTSPKTGTGWLRPGAEHQPMTTDEGQELHLYQDSSGGDAWQSLNHVNADGQPIPRFRGYRFTSDGQEQASGNRAQPSAGIRIGDHGLQATLSAFWQNFPSSISAGNDSLTVGLFPGDVAEPYELQGGERKTQTLWLTDSADPDALAWVAHPLRPTLCPDHYQQAQAFPWFQANAEPGPLEALIHEGLEGQSNFFAKREIIDEYGWRNFGDIFADHETLYQAAGEAPLISHYNNQYDAIYGFARQYALTGDTRWFELMDDLARHVVDIDIYHTTEDRSEYNNGLFWHTDHYLPAHTATHRTFSKHNSTSSTPGQTGGGPASEHCYTTGLLYHYYLTGAESSRQAVLQLADWMKAMHEGQGGLLEQLLAMKKQDLPKARALIRGERPSRHTYPFTRGTGNYLNALLDAWQLQPDESWLELAEKVIRQTIHPADDIEQRQLLDVETGWSYLVLLTSINRYLWLKAANHQIDENYGYARDALVQYSRWMLRHERLFLEDSEQLEFPNDTWTAQDLRKVMLLRMAAGIDPENADDYLHQSDHWLQATCRQLAASGERHYARVQIILLQNHGPHQSVVPAPETSSLPDTPAMPRLTWGTLTARVMKRLARALATFRPARERAWLNARLDRP